MAVTIRDVAALAGVSPSTVSRTCKDNPSISEETKEKVRLAMAKLGYEPNFQASNLASQNSRTIGIVLPVSERFIYVNSFFLEIIRGITQYCNSRQYITTIIAGETEDEALQTIRSMVRNGLVDSFILLYSKQKDPITSYLYNEGILFALIGKAYHFANQTIYVDTDNILAGQNATEYLINLNHHHIGYIGYERSLIFSSDRKYGYSLAHYEHNIPLNHDYSVEVRYSPNQMPEELMQLLRRPDRPTAFVVADDFLGIALERCCRECGLSIPNDISVVSFNNSLFAELSSPPLTSIDINSVQLGIEAATQIINHAENPNLPSTKIIVPHRIVERESCKKL
ncbi:MAG: LacI family DNA-binding transcriptional regulator [Lachnospiraceae bacterium]|nr:LacI family DNA-binding transcriptional regulator [Lachnospiraceae bacterium]